MGSVRYRCGMLIAALLALSTPVVIDPAEARPISCPTTFAIDGDTFACGSLRVRVQGIDAPEMPGHCRRGRSCTPGDPFASTANLRRLLARGGVVCVPTAIDVYGRTVARCSAGKGRALADLSCAQLAGGFAVRRYAPIRCP